MSTTINIGTLIIFGGDGEVEVQEEEEVLLDADEPSVPVEADLGLMTDNQRASLFGLWNEVFGNQCVREERHEFTRAVLGTDAPVSWARHGNLTVRQANRLIDVLNVTLSLL